METNTYTLPWTTLIVRRKFNIVCPIHGTFSQTPASHLSGCGCSLCGKELTQQHNREQRLTQDQFVERSRSIHGNRYNYPNAYVSSKTKIGIMCPVHGAFYQTPESHMRGDGCPKCALDLASINLRMTKEEFVSRSRLIHTHSLYTYNEFMYINARTSGKIHCSTHGYFMQTPREHLYKAAGCPMCKRQKLGGRYSTKFCNKNPHLTTSPATIYVLRITTPGESFIKIGITRQPLSRRLSVYPFDNIEVLLEQQMTLREVWDVEQLILRLFAIKSYIPTVHFAGSTECFVDDVDVCREVCYHITQMKRSIDNAM
jgi:hypothetical protein